MLPTACKLCFLAFGANARATAERAGRPTQQQTKKLAPSPIAVPYSPAESGAQYSFDARKVSTDLALLSGFLISGILLETRGKPGYFRSFYMRRVLRIFPAYYLYLVLVAIALALIPAAYRARGVQPRLAVVRAVSDQHQAHLLRRARSRLGAAPVVARGLGAFLPDLAGRGCTRACA
jgi:hypothetical protein